MFKKIIILLVVLANIAPVAGFSEGEFIKSHELMQTGANQERWISIPESRLVINPFNIDVPSETSQVEFSNRPSLPLNVGYLSPWAEMFAPRISDAVVLYGNVTPPASGVVYNPNLSVTFPRPYSLSSGTSASYENGCLTFRPSPTADHHLITFKPNIAITDETFLEIDMRSADCTWFVTYNALDGSNDIGLTAYKSDTGITRSRFTDYLPAKAKATFNISIYIYPNDKANDSVSINSIKIINGVESRVMADTVSSTWTPHEVTLSGAYSNGFSVDSRDFFYDTETLVREIQAVNGALSVGGKIHGNAKYENGNIIVKNDIDKYRYAISFSTAPTSPPIYYPSEQDLIYKVNGSASSVGAGYWSVDYQALPENKLQITFSVTTTLEDEGCVTANAQAPFINADIEARRQGMEDMWDNYLEKVPVPDSFSISYVNNGGVTSALIEEKYYQGWVSIINSVLPPVPEENFLYSHMSVGKASLWAGGEARTAQMSSWDSLCSMQFYALIDPDKAWECFVGFLSLTDEEGSIDGESLPTIAAQTALIIHEMRNNVADLAQIYPELKQRVEWCINTPRWIYLEYTPDTEQVDSDFLTSAMNDIEYLMDIARIVGVYEDYDYLDELYGECYEKYYNWFFDMRGGEAFEYSRRTEGATPWKGHPLWTTSGLSVRRLEKPEQDSLIREFRNTASDSLYFNGFDMSKYAEATRNASGLIEKGYIDEAVVFIESHIRDTALSNFLAEAYRSDSLNATGVRPSSFGFCQIIDFVFIRNGFIFRSGRPEFTNIFNENTGIKNIHYGNEILNFTLDSQNERVTTTGDYLGSKTLTVKNGGYFKLPIFKDGLSESVSRLYDDGIIGFSDDYLYKPDKLITRFELADMVARAYSLEDKAMLSGGSGNVTEKDAADMIVKASIAANRPITLTTGGGQHITKSEAADMLFGALKIDNMVDCEITNVATWALNADKVTAVKNGIKIENNSGALWQNIEKRFTIRLSETPYLYVKVRETNALIVKLFDVKDSGGNTINAGAGDIYNDTVAGELVFDLRERFSADEISLSLQIMVPYAGNYAVVDEMRFISGYQIPKNDNLKEGYYSGNSANIQISASDSGTRLNHDGSGDHWGIMYKRYYIDANKTPIMTVIFKENQNQQYGFVVKVNEAVVFTGYEQSGSLTVDLRQYMTGGKTEEMLPLQFITWALKSVLIESIEFSACEIQLESEAVKNNDLSISASVKIINGTNTDHNGDIIIGVYKDGILHKVINNGKLAVQKRSLANVTIPIGDFSEAYTYKTFYWDNVNSLKPLTVHTETEIGEY